MTAAKKLPTLASDRTVRLECVRLAAGMTDAKTPDAIIAAAREVYKFVTEATAAPLPAETAPAEDDVKKAERFGHAREQQRHQRPYRSRLAPEHAPAIRAGA